MSTISIPWQQRPAVRHLLFVSVVLLGLATWFVGQAADRAREPALPTYRTLPVFEFRDQHDQPFSSDALRGKVWLASFIYTECPGPCPRISQKMSDLQNLIPPGVQLISFTLDPDTDTPPVLDKYAERFHAGSNWHFLTGAKTTLRTLTTGPFMLAAADSPPDDPSPIIHSTKLVLVDEHGTVRGYYESAQTEPGQIVQDMRRLLR